MSILNLLSAGQHGVKRVAYCHVRRTALALLMLALLMVLALTAVFLVSSQPAHGQTTTTLVISGPSAVSHPEENPFRVATFTAEPASSSPGLVADPRRQ